MSLILKPIEYAKEGCYTVCSIAKGHWVTCKNLFRKKVTLQYPEARWDLPEGYRGLPALPVDTETGVDGCIGCGACVRACPNGTITVEAHMSEDKKRVVDNFTLNAAYCLFCGLCVEACPPKALVSSKHYEMAAFSRDEMIFDRAKLNEIGGVKEPKPKPEPKEKISAEESASETS